MVRICVTTTAGSLELEGDEAFLDRYKSELRLLLDQLRAPASTIAGKGANLAAPAQGQQMAGLARIPDTFGEFLLELDREATDTDRIMFAAFYYCAGQPTVTFGTKDANDLLLGQGHKLSNPSQSIKNNLVAKRLFKHESGYRISQSGIKYVKEQLA